MVFAGGALTFAEEALVEAAAEATGRAPVGVGQMFQPHHSGEADSKKCDTFSIHGLFGKIE